MRAYLVICFLAVGMIFSTATVQAAVWTSTVFIDGLQETPPVATTGTGTATVTFNDVSGLMNVNGLFQDLVGTANNAHVHGYAAPGTPAGVVFGLAFTASTSGTVSGSGIIPASRIDDVLAGLTYINIHSTFKGGGEIRGQIMNFVPEPATMLLMTIGMAGVMTFRRNRRAVV